MRRDSEEIMTGMAKRFGLVAGALVMERSALGHTLRPLEREGLVGLVSETAEAVNLSDAPADPHFSYRPETGEDPFKSFLGVPIRISWAIRAISGLRPDDRGVSR